MFQEELAHLRNHLPEGIRVQSPVSGATAWSDPLLALLYVVEVQKVEERLSALGNCIACNDYVTPAALPLQTSRRQMIVELHTAGSTCAH